MNISRTNRLIIFKSPRRVQPVGLVFRLTNDMPRRGNDQHTAFLINKQGGQSANDGCPATYADGSVYDDTWGFQKMPQAHRVAPGRVNAQCGAGLTPGRQHPLANPYPFYLIAGGHTAPGTLGGTVDVRI